jgi:hypothetical protein
MQSGERRLRLFMIVLVDAQSCSHSYMRHQIHVRSEGPNTQLEGFGPSDERPLRAHSIVIIKNGAHSSALGAGVFGTFF